VIDSKALGVDYQPAVNAVGSNPLPASFDVDVRQLADLSQIDAMARGLPIVDSGSNNQVTDYNKDVIPRLQSAIFWIRLIGIVLGVILAIISLVIIMNTIRTAVYIRRTEIEIMKLVGATDWFVRWPFIIEGVLGGILAAVFGGTVVAVAYRLVLHQVNTSFLGIGYDAAFLTGLLFLLLAVGAALGAFGSYLGVRRFLNV
jgi:cell division transport system permease protein